MTLRSLRNLRRRGLGPQALQLQGDGPKVLGSPFRRVMKSFEREPTRILSEMMNTIFLQASALQHLLEANVFISDVGQYRPMTSRGAF